MDYGIHYTVYPKVLEGYSHSNWVSDANEIKTTSEYVFILGGGAVSWKSCKQTILTRSTMEQSSQHWIPSLLRLSSFVNSLWICR
jgi:hypothetical protein